jgi:glucan endo-1,3-beta-D-glucosidase
MHLLSTILLAVQLLASVACAVHTGFAYGAFWSEFEPKFKKHFVHQFNLAKNLPGLPVSFNSARLFQTGQWMNGTEPSEAFEAAIETNTTLLLGIWLGSLDQELIALDNAFEKHGQKLADLVVGISVGNEDIYRSSPVCTQQEGTACISAYTKEQVMAHIENLSALWPQKSWWKLFKTPPPIGHTDVATEAGLQGLDFTGTTIYPFWNKDPIDKANESFFDSLALVQQRAGQTPVWITETGWPSSGPSQGVAIPSVEAMQKFWTDVGCSLFGKYNVWWFQLERDTSGASGQLDWGIIDIPSKKLKIKDLSCPGMSNVSSLPAPTSPSSQAPASMPPVSSVLSTLLTGPSASAPAQIPSPRLASPPAVPGSKGFTFAPPVASPSTCAQPSSSPVVPTSPPAAPIIPTPPSPSASTFMGTSIPTSLPIQKTETVFLTTTIVVSVPVGAPAGPADPTTQAAGNTNSSTPGIVLGTTTVTQATGCITVANVGGTYITVASNPPGPGGVCTSPPPYPGPAYVK